VGVRGRTTNRQAKTWRRLESMLRMPLLAGTPNLSRDPLKTQWGTMICRVGLSLTGRERRGRRHGVHAIRLRGLPQRAGMGGPQQVGRVSVRLYGRFLSGSQQNDPRPTSTATRCRLLTFAALNRTDWNPEEKTFVQPGRKSLTFVGDAPHDGSAW
jgi:hypothetical protein